VTFEREKTVKNRLVVLIFAAFGLFPTLTQASVPPVNTSQNTSSGPQTTNHNSTPPLGVPVYSLDMKNLPSKLKGNPYLEEWNEDVKARWIAGDILVIKTVTGDRANLEYVNFVSGHLIRNLGYTKGVLDDQIEYFYDLQGSMTYEALTRDKDGQWYRRSSQSESDMGLGYIPPFRYTIPNYLKEHLMD